MFSKFCLRLVLLTLLKFSLSDASSNSCSSGDISPQNCKEVQEQGNHVSGVYNIRPRYALESFKVFCNMKSMGGGWTYILNRYDGTQNFYLDWNDYKVGFGRLRAEFWLGLEKIHLLTGYEYNELLIELVDWDDKEVYARYETFRVDSEKEAYALKVLQGYNGTAGDSFSHEAGMKFTTYDRDNDVSPNENCAQFSNAGWWYHDCKWGHLTGKYLGRDFPASEKLKGIYWVTFHGNGYSLKQVRMMVRPLRPIRATNPLLNF